MAANDDLDDFFKKKDRKGNKHKKPTGLLTNNEELLKQLVIVTSATTAFKENMDFDEEEEDEYAANNHNRHPVVEVSNGVLDNNQDTHKNQAHSTSVNNKIKSSAKVPVQDTNNSNEEQTGVTQQDEWEEFENSESKYKQLRLKFARAGNDREEEGGDHDEYYDDENHPDENTNNLGGDDEQSSRMNRRREQQQQKDKPAWKLDQVKSIEPIATNDTTDSPSEKVEEPAAPTKPSTGTSSVYRPPQLRGNSAVTVVSGAHQRPSKKEKPNLASTEEFPTLGATVHKK